MLNNLLEKLRKDSYAMGVFLGFFVPGILFALLFGILLIVEHGNPNMLINNPNLHKILIPKQILIALIPSLFILRYYLLKLKYDKTGRGIVITTFVIGILFVILQFSL